MVKNIGDYYLGLDIGTSSVGWAVTDPQYNIMEYHRKSMWGIHLFDEGKTAEERRLHRCSRRRLNRRKQRITLLRELFSEEICKKDPNFFERLDESSLHIEDRKNKQSNSIFNDSDFDDTEYHSLFPTIYHLRKYLMESEDMPDIRLVYLAIHHIIKYRGHFLYEGLSEEDVPDFETVYNLLIDDLRKYELDIEISDKNPLMDILTDRTKLQSDKKRVLESLYSGCDNSDKSQIKEFIILLSGGKAKLASVFSDSELGDSKISLKDPGVEDDMVELEDLLDSDQMISLRLIKQIYDWSVLSSLLKGYDSISYAKVASYEQHKVDLEFLKNCVKEYNPAAYKDVFKSPDIPGNYCSYIGSCSAGVPKRCSYDDFRKYCYSILGDKFKNDEKNLNICKRLDEGIFMPKQRFSDNSVLPYTVHLKELKSILKNVSKWYPFLSTVADDGYSVSEKIEMILRFRVPYYVGPLDTRSQNAWVIRNSSMPVRPWNIGDIVDLDGTAERFITRMTNFCTYLVGEKVLPKNSVTYSYFSLYNELNNIRIDGDKLDLSLKRRIVRDLFEQSDKKVTKKRLQDYLVTEGLADRKDLPEISGMDDSIKTSFRSIHQIRAIIGDKIENTSMTESIIRTITVFEDKKRIESKLTSDHGKDLSKDEIKKLSKLNMNGWGRLSEKFLTGLYDVCRENGIKMNILTMMECTQDNLMEIIHKYSFQKQVDELNLSNTAPGLLDYSTLDSFGFSPAVKRSIWRSINVVKDVIDCVGHDPVKVFVETTRENLSDQKVRTTSRKDALMQLYKKCGEDAEWIQNLSEQSDEKLKQRSLYLYYTQLGRCMYCGRRIDFDEIGNSNLIDLDHIYPQSKVVDDSIHKNMVLSCRVCNAEKSNMYPINPDVQQKMRSTWEQLLAKGYITSEKYARLTRTSAFTDDELDRFISRQIVETSQSVKGTISLLKLLMPDTDIVYVKAGMVSEFRHQNDFIKCRSVNDYHHAKDAYLNIVVGNVYDVKFTKSISNFIQSHEKYNLKRMYDFPVSRNGVVAWVPGENGSIVAVRKSMRRDNILFVKYPYVQKGQLFDDQLLKKSDTLFEKKKGLDVTKYGGFNKIKGACYCLVEYKKGKKTIRSLETIPVMDIKVLSDSDMLEKMFSERLGCDVKVIIPMIRMNTMFEWGTFPLHIGGRTGNNIVFYNGLQLLMPDDIYAYCKKLFKFDTDSKDRIFHSASYYDISLEMNMMLYDYLLNKSVTPPYNVMLSALADNLKKSRGKFIESSELVQASVLNEILHSFQCNATSTSFKKIDGVGLTGRIILNSKLPDFPEIYIVNQSSSGLRANKVRINR